jgi:hypothetical protein
MFFNFWPYFTNRINSLKKKRSERMIWNLAKQVIGLYLHQMEQLCRNFISSPTMNDRELWQPKCFICVFFIIKLNHQTFIKSILIKWSMSCKSPVLEITNIIKCCPVKVHHNLRVNIYFKIYKQSLILMSHPSAI